MILSLLFMVLQGAWALTLSDDYYLIGTAQDLKDFAALVNSGSTTANGKLIAPIDLQGSNENQWTPIGTSTNLYNGTFDGQGFTISNLYYHQEVASAGLFSRAGNSARIKNVHVVVDIDNTGNGATTSGGKTEAGGILGTGAEGTLIINCSVSGSVLSFSNVGGIVGTGSVTVVNCYNEATVKFYSNNGQVGGGIHGYGGSPTLNNCYNVGKIINTGQATSHMGNIAAGGTATNCYSLENCCQNGAGAAWSNKANNGIAGTTMTSSEMQTASFVTTLNTNVESLKSTYTDIDTWKLDPRTNLPTQLSSKLSEGPWTYVDYTHGICGSGENSSISWNNLNHTQWDGNDFTQISNSMNGTGFSAAGSTKEPYDAKMCIYSWYYCRQIIPSYSRMKMTWNFSLKSHLNSLAQQVGLYAHSDPYILKSTALDFTYGNTTNAGSNYLVKIHSHAGDNQDASVNDSHIFYFDNSNGSTAQEKRNDLILTQILWAGDATISLQYDQWATFKNNSYSFSYDYYKHITFNANGGAGSMAVQQIENSGTLTANSFTRSGYTFAGWNTQADGKGTSYADQATLTATSSDKGLVTLYAQWTENKETLKQTEDNSTFISTNNGVVYDITLTRTLQAGGWNTFCVPFNISSAQITSIFGEGTKVRELNSSNFNSTTKALTLNFTNAESIEAGKPYLVKVDAAVPNPTFSNVTIVDGTTEVTPTGGYVTFVPVMNPIPLSKDDKTVLFVTGGDKLTYPNSTGNINGFRAYFKLLGDAAANARSFNMSFDDDPTMITTTNLTNSTNDGTWHTLDGCHIEGQPIRKGVYIHNGKKTVIK